MGKTEKRSRENKPPESSSGNFLTRPSFWWVPIIVVIISSILAPIGLPIIQNWFINKPTPTQSKPQSAFQFIVRVQDKISGVAIPNAQVIVEVSGQPPLTTISDSLGNAVLIIDTTRIGQLARLRIEAVGFQIFSQTFILETDKLPTIIPLTSLSLITISTFTPPIPVSTSTPNILTNDAYQSRGDCDKNAPPCTYKIREDDTYFALANKFYNDRVFVWILLEYNRQKEDGFYILSLQRGMEINVPSKDSIPPLPFPNCGDQIKPPCKYSTFRKDTYEIVAQDVYKNVAMANFIREANQEYDAVNDALRYKTISEGTILVVPRINSYSNSTTSPTQSIPTSTPSNLQFSTSVLQKNISVSGVPRWQKSGVSVLAGYQIEISYSSGVWCGGAGSCYDANGAWFKRTYGCCTAVAKSLDENGKINLV